MDRSIYGEKKKDRIGSSSTWIDILASKTETVLLLMIEINNKYWDEQGV
jgi:hypothetical protein